jgi:hypothetical protein
MRRTSSFIIIFLLILMIKVAYAEVTVNLPDTSAYPGDTLCVPVHTSDLTGLEVYSYQFSIKYDSTVVKAIGADSAKTLTESWGTTWISLKNPGEVTLGSYDVAPLQNSGTLIYILFSMIGEIGDSIRLMFQDFEFNAGQPTTTITNGSIKILHPPVSVQFKTNIAASLKIQLDGVEQNLPFDTTWTYGSIHTIGTNSPQYPTEDIRFSFKNWSDGGDTLHSVMAVSDTTFSLNMNEEFLLTINSEYGVVQGGGWYINGESASFLVDSTAQETDSTRYAFEKWKGTGNSSYTGNQRIVKIIMNDPVIETAEWKTQHYLRIESPYGSPIGDGWHDQGDTVAIGIDSFVSLVEGTRSVFDSWEGQGEGSYSGDKRIVEVILSAPIREQAFWHTEHYLNVKSAPEGLTDFKKSGWYVKRQNVATDTAKQSLNLPEVICHFLRWSVDGQAAAGNPIQILMDTSHTAEAIYQIDSVLVTINTNIGTGTSIFVDNCSYPVPYARFWTFQSAHLVGIDTIQFAPCLKSRYQFSSWSDRGSQQHVIQVDSVLQLTAFLSTQHFLFADTHPPGLIKFTAMGWYDQGNSVTLSPAPQQVIIEPVTFNFKGWYVDRVPAHDNPITVVMDKPHSAIALYTDFYFITGEINDSSGRQIPNAAVILSGVFQDTFRISTGTEYNFNFLIPGDYQVTPYGDGFRFEPPYRIYASLNNSFSIQDFVAIDTLKPEISLVYPNGGERLQSTAADTITWQAKDNMGIDSIFIELSIDNGNSWHEIAKISPADEQDYIWNVPVISSSQCNIRIQAVDFDGNRAFDTSDSPFSINYSSSLENAENEQHPTKFQVQQNYPNPFNSSTIIRFQIPEATQVKLTIFNMMGQEIVTLLDQKLNAGYHQVKWDGKDRSGKLTCSGIYFYQVEASGKFIIKRLLYIR